jgi:hypothetical protein
MEIVRSLLSLLRILTNGINSTKLISDGIASLHPGIAGAWHFPTMGEICYIAASTFLMSRPGDLQPLIVHALYPVLLRFVST